MAEKANADLGTLAQLLGHKTLKITMRYRHLTDQQYAPLVEKMAQAVFQNQHPAPHALEPSLVG
jgi:site-specific recombinase XerD